jgi:osmotically-inducible protein OsmY
MDRDQMRDRQYQGDRFEDESSSRGGSERTMTDPSQDRQRQGGQRGMERSGSRSSEMTTSGEAGGDWQGFVVPYRYYGPGYAGLGYYAVYYQGGAGQRDEGDTSQDFDQRNAQYAQGQGAGAAWQSGRSQGQSQRYGGQSGNQRGQWQNQGGQWGQGAQWGGQSGSGYAGRGPKGYRRSDERIREEISDQFMENDQLDASEIEVKVADGVVTLTGSVEDRQAKRLAEDMAERASGVRDVMNHLKVDNESSMRRRGGDQYGTTGTGSSTGSSGSRTTSGTRSSSSSTGSRSRSGTSSGSGSRSSTRTTAGSQARSGTGQTVGAGTGGATDGATGNGSNRDQANRESEGGSR